MRIACSALAVLFTTCSAAGAANLVENAGFDDDLAGWAASDPSAYSTADALGSPLSGSIEITTDDPADPGAQAVQCVPVVAGRTYAFGASAFIPRGQPVNSAFVQVAWSSMPECPSSDLVPAAVPAPYFVALHGVWGTTQSWNTAPPGAQSARLALRFTGGNGQVLIRARFDNAFFLEDVSCASSPTTLCLSDGRFRVVTEWLTEQGDAGFGHAVPLTTDSGYFWFFNDANVELVAKLINACPSPLYDHFWFFAAGLTDVQTTIRVRDTGTDTERIYMNPQKTAFAPLQDILAFDTCP